MQTPATSSSSNPQPPSQPAPPTSRRPSVVAPSTSVKPQAPATVRRGSTATATGAGYVTPAPLHSRPPSAPMTTSSIPQAPTTVRKPSISDGTIGRPAYPQQTPAGKHWPDKPFFRPHHPTLPLLLPVAPSGLASLVPVPASKMIATAKKPAAPQTVRKPSISGPVAPMTQHRLPVTPSATMKTPYPSSAYPMTGGFTRQPPPYLSNASSEEAESAQLLVGQQQQLQHVSSATLADEICGTFFLISFFFLFFSRL